MDENCINEFLRIRNLEFISLNDDGHFLQFIKGFDSFVEFVEEDLFNKYSEFDELAERNEAYFNSDIELSDDEFTVWCESYYQDLYEVVLKLFLVRLVNKNGDLILMDINNQKVVFEDDCFGEGRVIAEEIIF